MPMSDLPMCVRGLLASLALGFAAFVVTAPVKAAYPGAIGPLAYSKITVGETEAEYHGGLLVHGPRERQAPRQLSDEPGDGNPSYSPDGRFVAFEGKRHTGENPSGTHIFVMESDGSDIRRLTGGDFYDSNPSFSLNGKLVVFDRVAMSGGRTHIFSVSVNGSGLRQVTHGAGDDYDPVFTPNGRRIVFVSSRRSNGRRDRSNIFSMRPDGGRARMLIGGPGAEFDPDVSPSGRWIAFASNRRRGGPNIFVARIDGRRLRELTHSRDNCRDGVCHTSPSWAPDGKHIAFHSRTRSSSAIDVIRADGRRAAKQFDSGRRYEDGYGVTVGAPGWGPRPR